MPRRPTVQLLEPDRGHSVLSRRDSAGRRGGPIGAPDPRDHHLAPAHAAHRDCLRSVIGCRYHVTVTVMNNWPRPHHRLHTRRVTQYQIKSNQIKSSYFIVRLKVDQRAGQLSLTHLEITKTEKIELKHKTDEQISPVNGLKP